MLLKVDSDAHPQAMRLVSSLLHPNSRDYEFVDELLWRQRTRNYLVQGFWWEWPSPAIPDWTTRMSDVYRTLLRLRQRGVRAHVWV